jgi:hypothetical protein
MVRQLWKSESTSEIVLGALAVGSYSWLSLSWFDHALDTFFARTPPLVPAFLLGASLLALSLARRARAPEPTDDEGRRAQDRRNALIVFVVAFLSRAPFAVYSYGLFSSDAAAQGVMALHILEDRHHPVFLYKWSYVGSLKAHLTALFAWASGEPVVSFAVTAVLIYAAFACAIYLLARQVLPELEALFAAGYVVVAPGFLTAWGMGNEGNYLDVLLFGTLALLYGVRLLKRKREPTDPSPTSTSEAKLVFFMGLYCGLAFWTHILATYYILTCVAVVLVASSASKARTLLRLPWLACGFVVGDFPGVLWNASNEWLSFRWWGLDAETVGLGERLERTFRQLGEVLTESLAVLSGYWPRQDPPWPSGLWYVMLLGLMPAAAAWFAFTHRDELSNLMRLRGRGRVGAATTMLAFALLVILVFAQSSFGWMTEEPRYLLFLFSVVPIFVAGALGAVMRRSKLGAALLVVALGFVNVRGYVLYLNDARKSDETNRTFVHELDKLGVRYLRSDYHLSYKYTFLTHGRTIWTSELGPAQTEWYEPYRDETRSQPAEEVALVPRSFRFARRLGRRLEASGIEYRRKDLLYPILYQFSAPYTLEALR